MDESIAQNVPFEIVEEVTRGGTSFQVLEYAALAGNESAALVERVYALNKSGQRTRQLRVKLDGDSVRTEPGALQFLKGDIEMQSNTGDGDDGGGGVGGFIKGAVTAARTGETLFKPLYRGTGELYLEPTFGHLWLIDLQEETYVADQGLFRCAENSVDVGAHKVESRSARMAGGEGRYQTKMQGTGIIALMIGVPRTELVELTLDDETLQVDGSFALLRTGDIRFTVEKASDSFTGAMTSGEGLLQTFRGTGRVWIAPTQPVYQQIQNEIRAQQRAAAASGSSTK